MMIRLIIPLPNAQPPLDVLIESLNLSTMTIDLHETTSFAIRLTLLL